MAEATKSSARSSARSSRSSGFNTPAVVLIALAVLLFVYALALFLQGGFLKAYDLEYQAKVLNVDGGPVVEETAAQKAILDEGFRWVDQANGKVGVPIEDAKALVVKKGR